MPSDDFRNTSGAGTYGDFVQMVDAAVGKVMTVLDSLNMDKNTLVVFTSDNGPYWRPEFVQRFGHRAAGPWKGMKADIWEGGHRIPFIVRWPGVVNAGSVSHATTALTNLMATCTEITGIQLPADEAVDSYSIFPVLKGKAEEVPLQRAIIHHSSQGHFAVRQGQWKYIEQSGSGGFSEPQRYEPGPGEPSGELYDLVSDPAEENNRFKDLPDQVAKMQGLLDSIRSASAGNAQPNRIKGTR